MKIIYLTYHDINSCNGVSEKIINYCEEFNVENECMLVSVNCKTIPNLKLPFKWVQIVESNRFRYILNVSIIDKLIKIIENYQPQMIYLRYPLYRFNFNYLRARYHGKLIIELNSIAEYELKYHKKYFKLLFEKIFDCMMLSLADGITSTSLEFIEYYRRKRKLKKTNYLDIGNPIITRNIDTTSKKGKNINVIYIGNEGSYDGIEKIIDMAKDEIVLNIAGVFSKNTIRKYTTKNILFRGYLKRSELEKLLLDSDIGIGPMGYDKIHLKKVSPLKVRKYLSFGIPVIINYNDGQISDKEPFIYKINNNRNLTYEDVKYLYNKKMNENLSEKAVEYARETLSFKKAVKKIINFTENL